MRILTEEQKKICKVIDDFCLKEIIPYVGKWDEDNYIPTEVYAKAFPLGLNTFEIPKEYGGMGVDLMTAAVMYEQMGYYDGNFSSVMNTTNLALKPVLIAGTDEQKKYFSEIIMKTGYAAFALTEHQSGSDASNVQTIAVRDGDDYIINGEKCFITNGAEAGAYVVFAATDKAAGTKGLTAFIVERDREGVSVPKLENKMGFRTLSTADIKFDNVRVPVANRLGEEGKGFKTAMITLDKSRACVGAIAVGMAQRALDEAISYARQRVTFGHPIIQNQGIQWMLADMEIKVQTSRQMVEHANELQMMGLPFSKECAIAKAYATDSCTSVCLDAIQIMGGNGYMHDYPVEKIMRDAKAYQIFEGTNQVQRIVIANNLMKEDHSVPPRPEV